MQVAMDNAALVQDNPTPLRYLGAPFGKHSGELSPSQLADDAITVLYDVSERYWVVAGWVIRLGPFAGCAVCLEPEVFVFPRIFAWRKWRGRGHGATAA